MWLFDNIFLDEENMKAAAAAVADRTEPQTEEVTKPETSDVSENISDPQAAPQWEMITQPTPENIDQSTNPAVAFDIGGDLDFGGTSAPLSLEKEESSGQTTPQEALSFTVNGVSYNSAGPTPDGTTDTESAEPNTDTVGSIAMVQGSTAASGINIIDTTSTPDATSIQMEATPAIELSLGANSETDNSLMNILGSDTTETSSPSVITLVDEPVVSEIPLWEVTPEPLASEETSIISSLPGDITPDSITGNPEQKIQENSSIDESQEPSIETSAAVTRAASDLSGILDGFIQELNDREMEISRIIMKRHELTRRRTDVEEEYKTRILALNMEDEFLKSKADRERSEQDKLQGVIKNFQKQIAANE